MTMALPGALTASQGEDGRPREAVRTAVSSLDPQLLQFSEGSRKSTQDKLWLAEEQQESHWLHSSGVMGTPSFESQAVLQGVIKLFPSWPNFTRHHDGRYQTVCDEGTTSGHFVQLAGSGCSPRGPGTHYDNQANCKLAVTFPPLSLK